MLHYIIPLAIAFDWIMDPPSRRISFRRALVWLVFPLGYLVYSLVRGPIAGWYPYPFLDPSIGGYGQIVVTSILILIVGIVLAWIVSRVGTKVTKK